MARRRVQSGSMAPNNFLFANDEQSTSYDPAMIYTDPNEFSPEMLDEMLNISRLAQDPEPEISRDIPPIPYMREDQMQEQTLDQQPMLPEGLQLLADYAAAEANEDGLDYVAQTTPPEQSDYLDYDTGYHDMAPTGVELVGDLAEVEGREDGLDQFSETVPPIEQADQEIEGPTDEQLQGLPPAVIEAARKGPVDEITEEDIPTEGLGVIPGAVEASQQDPRITATLSNLLRLKGEQFDPAMMEYAKAAENAISKEYQDLNEREKALRDRIESGQTTKIDNNAIGMALVIPLLLSLFMGPQVLFGALEGMGKQYGELEKERKKGLQESEKELESLSKSRRQLDEKRLNLVEKLLSKELNPQMRRLFDEYDIVKQPDSSGNLELGSDAQAFEDKGKLKIGLKGGDDEELLWYDTDRLRRDKDRDVLDKKLEDGREVVRQLQETQENVDNIVSLMEAIKETDPSAYDVIRSRFAKGLPDQNLVSLLSEGRNSVRIRLKNPDGSYSEVDALPLLAQNIDLFMDSYRTAFLDNARFSGAYDEHKKAVMPDVKDVGTWLSQDIETMKTRAKQMETSLNKRMVGALEKEGFIRKPLEERFTTKHSQPVAMQGPRQEARRKILQETDLMKSLAVE